MRNFILYIIFTLFISNEIFCQIAEYPFAAAGEKGIFILLAGSPTSFYKIERTEEGRSGNTEIASVEPVSDADLFAERFNHYSAMFPDLLQPPVSELGNIWNSLLKSKSIDSLPYYGYSPVLRLALGIAYFDSSALSGKRYQYIITEMDNSSTITGSSVTNEVKYPGNIVSGKPKNSEIRIRNDYAFLQFTLQENEQVSSFGIYRQTNGKGDFEKVTADKSFISEDNNLILTLIDRSVESGSFYKYFIVPAGLFGGKGEYSDTVFCGIYDFNSLSLPSGISVESIDSLNTLKLSWSLDPMQPVVSVKIFRSEHYDSVFNHIADVSPEVNEYYDSDIVPMQKYFYHLQLTGPLNELSPATARVFGFCLSTEPPLPPVNITAEPLENGVKLTWQNSEEFIEGFRVYRTNGITDSLELISNLIKEDFPVTVYYDTLNISGKYTYKYAIKSETTSHVSGDFSDTVSVRPDIKTIPPQPSNLTAWSTDDGVLISWDNMTEIDSTVNGYIILRSEQGMNEERTTIPLTETYLDNHINFFNDNSFLPGNRYKYSVIAFDMFGGISTPAEVLFSPDVIKPLPPSGLICTSTDNGVQISWQQNIDTAVALYKVYRKTGAGIPEYIGSVPAGSNPVLSDKGTEKGELYHYFVTSLSNEEIESDRSEIVFIRP